MCRNHKRDNHVRNHRHRHPRLTNGFDAQRLVPRRCGSTSSGLPTRWLSRDERACEHDACRNHKQHNHVRKHRRTHHWAPTLAPHQWFRHAAARPSPMRLNQREGATTHPSGGGHVSPAGGGHVSPAGGGHVSPAGGGSGSTSGRGATSHQREGATAQPAGGGHVSPAGGGSGSTSSVGLHTEAVDCSASAAAFLAQR